MIDFSLTVDLSGLERLERMLRGGDPEGIMDDMLHQWGARYLAFTKRRFVQHSKGGGDWKPLAESTLLRRRQGKIAGFGGRKPKGAGKTKASARRFVRGRVKAGALDAFSGHAIETAIMGSAAILRDTGVLLNSLDVGSPGNLFEILSSERKVRVGFGAVAHGDGGPTIQQIAAWHNAGGQNGRPPQRVIFAMPDEQTVAGMMTDVQRAIDAAGWAKVFGTRR